MGEKGIQIMTRLINKIYKSGYIPEDFRESIFVPIPKVSKAQECGDFRTIALISHASKVLLHLIKRRITPIIERQLVIQALSIEAVGISILTVCLSRIL